MKHNASGFSSFSERKNQEKTSYAQILNFFEKSGFQIEDVSENANYFKDDIDFFIFAENKKFSCEVKIDSWIGKTGNFFFEIISNEQKSTPGCFLLSKADFFVYFDVLNQEIYIFPLKKLQSWIFEIRDFFENKKKIDVFFPLISTHTERNEKYSHTTIGRKIPKKYILGAQKCKIPFLLKSFENITGMQELEKLLLKF